MSEVLVKKVRLLPNHLVKMYFLQRHLFSTEIQLLLHSSSFLILHMQSLKQLKKSVVKLKLIVLVKLVMLYV